MLGCAKDIVEHCGVPRFVWSDFPLGNSAGKPSDAVSQAGILELGLTLLERAFAPRTTVQSPYRWAPDDAWKTDFWAIDDDPERLARQKAAFEAQKAIMKAKSDEAAAARQPAADPDCDC